MGLGRALHAAANTLTMWAIRAGVPRPPYTRRNAIVVETMGRRSGRPRRIPVGFVEDGGRLHVVDDAGCGGDHARGVRSEDAGDGSPGGHDSTSGALAAVPRRRPGPP
jgi:hypothetical protein